MSQTEQGGTLRERFPLRQVKIVKKSIGPIIMIILLLGLGVLFLAAISPLLALGGLLVVAFFSGIVVLYQWFYFKNYFYDLTPNGLVIRKGVIASWSITLPAHKVQDVYLDQDLLDRVFGLYDLHLSSATDVSQREAHIDGISKEDADALRRILLQWISGVSAAAPAAQGVIEPIKPAENGKAEAVIGSVLVFLLFGLFFLPMLLLVPFAAIWAYLDFTVLRYELRRDGVFVRSGFFIPKESIFLYRNIQDVEENQTILDRIFGLRTLTVKTMTTSSVLGANLPYLSEGDAQRIRQKILELRSVVQSQQPALSESRVPPAQRPIEAAPAASWPALENPFPNDFMTAALYSTGLSVACYVPLGIAVIIAGIFFPPLLMIGAAIAILMPLLSAAGNYLTAILARISYSYAVYSDRVMIKYEFIGLNKRELPFTKVQDIEKHVSFSNSFARLADIKFETGAKELLRSGRDQRTGSVSLAVESVQALHDSDADKLKSDIAQRMGLTLSGLGANPLVSRFPLAKVKPVKKSLGLALGLALLFLLALPFTLSQPLVLAGLAVAEAALLAAKFAYETAYYRRYYYDMNNDVLVIRKGVFGSRELTVPLVKIQDVFISRDLFDVLFGLYDVYISTATSRSVMNAHIDGVGAEGAEELALLLVDKIAEKK